MRLTDPVALVAGVLDRRLLKDHSRPVAVALSGGGDSVALLLAARAWGTAAGRALIVLTVDHGLNPQSAAWTAACAERAWRLGLPFQALQWTGEKPLTGLAAAAREARHRLLAVAAREAGARVILMGHTADDLMEAQAMRQAGSTTPDPREWAPSPIWPNGRDIFLLRPLLAARRADLRDWLAGQGETWIEDPANENPESARARARKALAGRGAVAEPAEPASELAATVIGDAARGLQMSRAAACDARLLGMAAVCAGGGDRRPAAERLARVAVHIAAGEDFTATLAGARIEVAGDAVLLLREAGEAARGGLAPVSPGPDAEVVWDGRYVLTTRAPGLRVVALAGHAGVLCKAEQARLKAYPSSARRALPLVMGEGIATCPLLAEGHVVARSLVLERLRAAAGLISREPA